MGSMPGIANAYSQARTRLPLELLQAALARIQDQILKLVGLKNPSQTKLRPEQRVRQIVDGSTVPILVTPELGQSYPPARNQHGRSDWCLVRIVVGFCTRCGAVLSTHDGPASKSEQVLFWEMIERAQAFIIWVGDRNFGVWSVAAQRAIALGPASGVHAGDGAQGNPCRRVGL